MSDKFDIKPHIIIDTGTGFCKSGFSTEETPSSIISCLVGRPKYASGRVGFDKKKIFHRQRSCRNKWSTKYK